MSGHWGSLDESDMSHFWLPAGSEVVRSACGIEAAPESVSIALFFDRNRCVFCLTKREDE